MSTPQSQIKVNLPFPLKDFVQTKADKFGLPLAGYIKHLILKDVENLDFPTFQASEKTEKAYQRALANKRKGRGIKITDVNKFFNEL